MPDINLRDAWFTFCVMLGFALAYFTRLSDSQSIVAAFAVGAAGCLLFSLFVTILRYLEIPATKEDK